VYSIYHAYMGVYVCLYTSCIQGVYALVCLLSSPICIMQQWIKCFSVYTYIMHVDFDDY